MANLQRENIELDKYTIGGEKGSPIGGAYFHVKEEEKPSLDEAYNVSIRGDIDDIDSIEYEPNDVQEDEDDEDFEPTYDINAYDNEGEYVLCGELTIDEILDYFDEDILNMLTNHEGRKISSNIYRIDDLLMRNTTPSDVNNVEEVNRIAKKIATGGPSQYLLVDGELIAFHDHIYITSVDGMTPSKFLSLGNIRLGSNSIELMKEPTREQCVVLKQFIQGKKEIYLDISKYKEGSTYGANIVGACYNNPNPNRVVNDIVNYFENGIKPLGNMAFESRRRYKYLVENLGLEVSKEDVDLTTLSKKNSLNPNIWDGMKLNPKIRLKLLDIADDFWEFVDVKWVDPISIILTGSICNFNWSDASDIDLHLVVDYSEVDEKTEFVKQFFDMKKNEWNENHSSLEIMGFNVELYVQDSNADLASQGVYDLEENKWISEPSMPQGNFAEENESAISDLAARIMTLIDELENEIAIAKDTYKSRYFGELASEFVSHIHKMRHDSLEKQGEDSIGNMVYKVLRRSGYIDKIYDAIYLAYDKENSIDESKEPLNEYDVYYECITESTDIFSAAKSKFGVTRDLREGGFVLPDGSVLDFSGRHALSSPKGNIDLRGRRTCDHNDIGDLMFDDNGNKVEGIDDIDKYSFMNLGAVRIDYNEGLISLVHEPTSKQLNVIKAIWRYNQGCVTIDFFAPNGDINDSVDYDHVKWTRLVADLDKYFNEGINPSASNNMYYEEISRLRPFVSLLSEEIVADGNSEHNPYSKRWKAEREALKSFISNYGKVMTSKENGKEYMVYYDDCISNLIGFNYVLCLQWDRINMKPKSTVYIRALDKFTNRIFQANNDTRGRDNEIGTNDDTTLRQ